MIDILVLLLRMLIFPGILFIIALAMSFHWLDRKLIARFQGRVGPPWYQPLADILKLFSKEDILPEGTNLQFATALPLVSFASVLTAGIYTVVGPGVDLSFDGDFVVILFLLSIPSLLYFLAGYTTSGVYSVLGGTRSLLQYFSYEVLFLVALSGTVIASGDWSLQGIQQAQVEGVSFVFPQAVGFFFSLSGLIGKLKREPYDIPKAKSEVIMGPLTEFSGKKLGLWFLTIQVQAIAGMALLVHCYFGGFWQMSAWTGFLIFLALLIGMQFILSAISAIFARLRIDQLIHLNWRVFIPLSLLHCILVVVL